MRTPRFSYRVSSLLMLLGMLACCTDIPNIDFGGFKLKISYLAYIFLPLVVWADSPGLPARLYGLSALLALFFLPSLAESTNHRTSFAFFGGLLSSILIMLSTAQLVKRVGPERTISVYRTFYRAAVCIACVPFLAGWTARAHFTLYEPSYYAIMLIPYFCITFDQALKSGWRSVRFDGFLIAVAMITSESVSMVAWLVLSLVIVCGQHKMLTLKGIAMAAVAGALFCAVALEVSPRVSSSAERLGEALKDPEVTFDAIIYIVGNRLQKALVAYEVFQSHVFTGVGMGALREYAGGNLDVYDFLVGGFSASDFEIDSNAANVYLEVGAEAGLPGLVGLFLLLAFLFQIRGKTRAIDPFKAGLAVTSIALLIESSYLRSYVWNLYGIILGLGIFPRTHLLRTAVDSCRTSPATTRPLVITGRR